MKKQAKRIFWNAILLTGATLLMRTVGVSFQVYISNRVGAEAMGLFSLMSGVYGFALTFATSGIHLGVTHLVVEAIGKGKSHRVGSIMKKAALYSLFFGGLAALLLGGGAEWIGIHWLKDARTVRSLRLFSMTLPLIALAAAWNGYFTAVRRPYKTAVSQVAEQLMKILFTMRILTLLLPYGIEGTCSALVLGGSASEICSFLLEMTLFLLDQRKYRVKNTKKESFGEGRKLCKISLPVALSTYLRSGLITLEHILIPEGLRNSGSSHKNALAAYGSIHSMALPVVLYPAALISSFSGLLIPELSESLVQGRPRRINYIISRVWWLSLFFSIGVAGIMCCFSKELGEALYPGSHAGDYIRILAPLIPIMYVDTATDAMMKGLGEQVYSMNINIIDALVSVIMVWILVPQLGINGYLITIYFSEFFNTVFSIAHLLSVTKAPVKLLKWIYKPLVSIVGATVLTRFLLIKTNCGGYASAQALMLHCLIALLFYFLFAVLLGVIDREDTQWICSLFQKEKHTERTDRAL